MVAVYSDLNVVAVDELRDDWSQQFCVLWVVVDSVEALNHRKCETQNGR